MTDDPRILRLVQESLDSDLSPEQVCADTPELLAGVRAEFERCQALAAQLDDMFAPSYPRAGSSAGPLGSSDLGSASSDRRSGSSDHPLGPSDTLACATRFKPPGRRRPGRAPAAVDLPEIAGYEVRGLLGRGGMGAVYRAVDPRLGRAVALKTLLAGAYAGGLERARFAREARTIAALRHPNVVQVYDVGEHDGRPYFTMELVEGGTLGEKLAGVPMPADRAAAIVESLAQAVEAAHRAGIVHRDLKPGNVLLSPDGTPKVTDFGLAHRCGTGADEGVSLDEGLTLTGQRIGTPSYMAPEQASPRFGAVGPAADVYALGAILYEALTGRPPFRGESAAETERQLLVDEPVAPAKLNPRVPRDLENVCLKCLRKEQMRRYPSAAELAADLGRFRRGEPVTARRAGRTERTVKWARRHPAVAVAIVAGTLGCLVFGGGGVWLAADRAATAREVSALVDRAAAAQRRGEWKMAEQDLDRAGDRLGDVGPADLRSRLARARDAAALVRRLDEIRTAHQASTGGVLGFEAAQGHYAEAFSAAGIGSLADAPAVVAARIAASDVRPALMAAVYDWLRCTPPRQYVSWLFAIARLADPDPTGWRERALTPATWRDPVAADALLADPAAAGQSVDLLLLVGLQVKLAGRDVVPYFRRVQQAHPGDFWVNLAAGDAARSAGDHHDAVRYFQSAAALRPEAAVARFDLAYSLAGLRRFEEAELQYREAIRLDPTAGVARAGLAFMLASTGRHADAVEEYRRATTLVRTDRDAMTHARLGDSLLAIYQDAEAEATFRRALELDPAHPSARQGLRAVLIRRGKFDEALAGWAASLAAAGDGRDVQANGAKPVDPKAVVPKAGDPKAVGPKAIDPRAHAVWNGYAECCLYAGREDDYRRAYQAVLDRFGECPDPNVSERVGRAGLLLASADPEVLRRATAAVDRAVASQSPKPSASYPYFMVAKALAELRNGRPAAALKLAEAPASRVLLPAPKLIAALSQAKLGHQDEARRRLAEAAGTFDWNPDRADNPEAWIYHVLRREAEAAILPEFPAYLAGTYQPKDVVERVAMTAACQSRRLFAGQARLWAEVIEESPPMAGQGRALAVGAAALAGCGQGADAATQSEADRGRWRKQAYDWALAEYAAAGGDPSRELSATRPAGTAAAVPTTTPEVRNAQSNLTRWLAAPELAGIRDPADVAKLPPDQRRQWERLWKQIAAIASDGKPTR